MRSDLLKNNRGSILVWAVGVMLFILLSLSVAMQYHADKTKLMAKIVRENEARFLMQNLMTVFLINPDYCIDPIIGIKPVSGFTFVNNFKVKNPDKFGGRWDSFLKNHKILALQIGEVLAAEEKIVLYSYNESGHRAKINIRYTVDAGGGLTSCSTDGRRLASVGP
ncbi:MAG: hypothetical protein KDD33_11510 [Bdellovibrionales bacterium]|nr:hypothetical protein [Bdellovibrionales bacterium]